jgi:hypothetical protein
LSGTPLPPQVFRAKQWQPGTALSEPDSDRFGRFYTASELHHSLQRERGRLANNRRTLHRALPRLQCLQPTFRELLQLKGDRYVWRVPPKEVFARCAESLYKALVNKSRQTRTTSQLGSDVEYWGACAQIVMRTQIAMTEERFVDSNA